MEAKLRVLTTSRYITFSSKSVDRFLRFRAFVFHLITFLFHAILNHRTFVISYYIIQTRADLLEKTCGLGIQYITIWNQFIQQMYFNACLLQDILEFTGPDRFVTLKKYLKEKLPYAFAAVVVPLAVIVLLNFWIIYPLDKAIIDEHDVTATYFPQWINHALHTNILVLVIVEKLVVYRSYPTKVWGFAGVTTVIMAYVFTCASLYFMSGLWPYPLFGIMSNIQRFCFVLFNMLLGFFVFVIGDKINRKIWGRHPGQVEAVTGSSKKSD